MVEIIDKAIGEAIINNGSIDETISSNESTFFMPSSMGAWCARSVMPMLIYLGYLSCDSAFTHMRLRNEEKNFAREESVKFIENYTKSNWLYKVYKFGAYLEYDDCIK